MDTSVANPEILLISAIIQTGDFVTPSSSGITEMQFHSHRQEFGWITDFYLRYHKVPDKATFRGQFPDFPLLRTTDVGHATEEVERSHLRHELATTLRSATTKLTENDPVDALALMHSSLTSLSRNGHREHDALRDIDDLVDEARRRVDASRLLGYSGLTFGFPTLNERTGGMQPGDLAIWAARLGQGKTWMLCKVVSEALLTGRKVVFVSLEQSKSGIAFRIHTLLAKELGYTLRHKDLMQGTNLDLDDYRSFLLELPERMSKGAELFIADATGGKVTPYTLAMLIERHEPDLVVVDYLTLMAHDGEDWRGMRNLSRETKLVAHQYQVPILAAAQINRLGEGGRRPPGTDKLAESDGIGQDSDIVVTMRRPSESVLQCMLAKNRSGQQGQIFHVAFQPNEGRIAEITHEEATSLMSIDAVEED